MIRADTLIRADRFDAVLYDMDGVLTSTAALHAACWKEMFDAYLLECSSRNGDPFEPFDIGSDYRRYVDGKLRYDGVRSFLASRGIRLPNGTPGDLPEQETVCGLGNRKDRLVKAHLADGEVTVFEGSIALVRHLREQGVRAAVVSASKNCRTVLQAAGVLDLFEQVVDGLVAEKLQLAGKPAPDTFLKAAELLGVETARAVVIEDALSGVEAGAAGGFGLVIGVDRHDEADALIGHGAHLVVTDLGELLEDA